MGVYGSYAALEPIIARYRQNAVSIYFPYPHKLPASGADARPRDVYGLIVVEFERDRLAVAAAQIRLSASTTQATAGAPVFAGPNGDAKTPP